jgi:hypothetical protein
MQFETLANMLQELGWAFAESSPATRAITAKHEREHWLVLCENHCECVAKPLQTSCRNTLLLLQGRFEIMANMLQSCCNEVANVGNFFE